MVGAETPDDCVWNEKSNKLKLLLLLLSPSFIPFWLVTFVIKAPVVGEARTCKTIPRIVQTSRKETNSNNIIKKESRVDSKSLSLSLKPLTHNFITSDHDSLSRC